MKPNVASLNVAEVKKDFPILNQTNRGKPLVYLDSAATAQKPRRVIEAISSFYSNDYANIHRGIFELSERSTQLYERARETVKQFIHARSADEIVFVSGTTGAINLMAQSYGLSSWQAGDEVILSTMEHHSNIVPWMMLKKSVGIVVKVIPVMEDGTLDMVAYRSLFTSKTKLVSVTHASNVLGVINPVKELAAMAHAEGVPILLDGAQAISHMPVDVQALDCDFYVFSGHKLYGPTGIGVLYGKQALLTAMPPYQGGGGMIETVSFSEVTYARTPQKFEAGTPNMAGAVGLAAAMDYLLAIGMASVYEKEQALLAYAQDKLSAIKGLRIIGTATPKLGVMSFVLDQVHAHDVGTILDHAGVAVRAGHHCAMPLMHRFKVPAMVRASLGIYNDAHDIDVLVDAITSVKRLFQ